MFPPPLLHIVFGGGVGNHHPPPPFPRGSLPYYPKPHLNLFELLKVFPHSCPKRHNEIVTKPTLLNYILSADK